MANERRNRPVLWVLLAVPLAIAGYAFAVARPAVGPASKPAVLLPAPGKDFHLLVRDGQVVQANQLIGELDVSAYKVELSQDEAELSKMRHQAESSIGAVAAMPTISGTLPARLPGPSVVNPSLAPAAPVGLSARAVTSEVANPDPYLSARDKEAKARESVDSASKELAFAGVELATAQATRDDLRPKLSQAEVEAAQSAKKAEGAQELLDAGVISVKRAVELKANSEAYRKALADLQSQAQGADDGIRQAEAKAASAKEALDRATRILSEARGLVAKAATQPIPKAAPTSASKPSAPATVKSKPSVPRLPRVFHSAEALPVPVKVFVDERAIENTSRRIEELERRISELKDLIGACRIVAPTSGRIRVLPQGSIQIWPV